MFGRPWLWAVCTHRCVDPDCISARRRRAIEKWEKQDHGFAWNSAERRRGGWTVRKIEVYLNKHMRRAS